MGKFLLSKSLTTGQIRDKNKEQNDQKQTLNYNEFNDVDKQQTIKWNSKEFNIEWPCANPIISKRDKNGKDK